MLSHQCSTTILIFDAYKLLFDIFATKKIQIMTD